MTEDLNTPMLHMRLPSRGSKILRRVTMKTEQEQIEKMARSMCGYCSTDGKCAVSKNGREPDICANVDTEHCLYKEYAERLIESGYGDVSEYKSEIERLNSNNGFLGCVISHSKDMMDEAVKEAQIDVLNKLKEKYGFYICCTWTHATKLLGEIIDEFIDKIKNEQDTSNDTARG